MGTFDYLTVEHALPDGLDPAGLDFQTKDTDEQWGSAEDLILFGSALLRLNELAENLRRDAE